MIHIFGDGSHSKEREIYSNEFFDSSSMKIEITFLSRTLFELGNCVCTMYYSFCRAECSYKCCISINNLYHQNHNNFENYKFETLKNDNSI